MCTVYIVLIKSKTKSNNNNNICYHMLFLTLMKCAVTWFSDELINYLTQRPRYAIAGNKFPAVENWCSFNTIQPTVRFRKWFISNCGKPVQFQQSFRLHTWIECSFICASVSPDVLIFFLSFCLSFFFFFFGGGTRRDLYKHGHFCRLPDKTYWKYTTAFCRWCIWEIRRKLKIHWDKNCPNSNLQWNALIKYKDNSCIIYCWAFLFSSPSTCDPMFDQ